MKTKARLHLTLLLAALALPSGLTLAADEKTPPEKKETAVKPYPLTTCIVTDNDLDSMGEETRIVYEGQEIKFCCKPCEKKFLKNPAKYLAKLKPETK